MIKGKILPILCPIPSEKTSSFLISGDLNPNRRVKVNPLNDYGDFFFHTYKQIWKKYILIESTILQAYSTIELLLEKQSKKGSSFLHSPNKQLQ